MRRVVAAGLVVGVLATCIVAPALATLLVGSDGSAMEAERVQVEMRPSGCTVDPNTGLAPGPTVFVTSNRSRRPRRFAISGSRTSFLKPGRTAKLVAQLHAGRVEYTCSASGSPRSVHKGAITVVRPLAIARAFYGELRS